jgi:hypothetical protein
MDRDIGMQLFGALSLLTALLFGGSWILMQAYEYIAVSVFFAPDLSYLQMLCINAVVVGGFLIREFVALIFRL